MRIRGSLSKVLLIVLALTLIPVTAVSAQKITPGSSCKVLNQKVAYQNKTYTCIKSGKKLIWNKGVAVRKPTPTPTPTPVVTPTPTPTPVVTPTPTPTPSQLLPLQPKDEVFKKIDQIRLNSLLNQNSIMPTIVFKFQGTTTNEIQFKTERSLLNAIPVYDKLGFKITDAVVLVARDMNWVKQELDLQGCIYGSLPDRPGFYVPNPCKTGNGVVTSVHWEAEKYDDGLDGLYFNHVIPHEYFHQIQHKLTPLGNGDFPKWFWEGSAQFFTNQAWASWNNSYSYLDWYQHWWTKLRPDLGPTACKRATIDLMSNPSTTGIEGICAYSKGQLIVEYLLSKYGIENYRKFYSQNSTQGWNNFSIVFKKVTGDEIENFYIEVEKFIASRGW